MAQDETYPQYTTKKCPECLIPLPLQATRCTACNSRVGPVNRIGIAQRPVDWMSYIIALAAVGAFVGFLWYLYQNHN